MQVSELDPKGKELPSSSEVAKDPKNIKVVARERFLAILGKTLAHVGIGESLAGRVLAAVMLQPTRIRTDFAYKPETGMGVIWGWSNGGAVKFPIPLDRVEMGTLISLKTGESFKLRGAGGNVGCGIRGYWVVAYRLNDGEVKAVEETTTAELADETSPRGQTKEFSYVDDAPFLNAPVISDDALKTGRDIVAAIDEAKQSTHLL